MSARSAADRLAGVLSRSAVLVIIGLFLALAITLLCKSAPAWWGSHLLGQVWSPERGRFGLLPFLAGSLAVSSLAMLLGTPICLLAALYLSEYISPRWRERLRPPLDILAAIPSVVFGLFGVLFIVPFVLALGRSLGLATSGYSLLAGALVLALMASPYIVSLVLEVLLAVPMEAREAAYSLGATQWETARFVVLRQARSGILAALVLGFARAFGETLAVLMVVGNVARMPGSPLAPAYPLPALLANTYGEMMSIPKMDGVLLTAALMLMAVTGTVSFLAALVLRRLHRERSC